MGASPNAVVLHLCSVPEFLRYLGPTLQLLAGQGHQVHVACSPGEELDVFARRHPAICVHPLALARAVDIVADFRSLGGLIRLMLELRPEVVHAHTPKAGLLGMVAASLTGAARRVYQMHGLRYQTASGPARDLLLTTERLSAALAHRVICVSASVQRAAVEDEVVSLEKTVVLGNGSASGIDVQEYNAHEFVGAAAALRAQLHIAPAAVCVAYLGRLAKDKGLSDLFSAWKAVSTAMPGAQLLLVGEEDSTDPLGALPQRADIHFLGSVSDPRALYALCDVVVLPSYREGLPQALLEAGAMGKPVVATRVTGIVDVVTPERTGLLVAPQRPDELAEALVRLLTNAPLRRELGTAARALVAERFLPSLVLNATREFYTELLASPPA